jgi:hypothetical protein
MVGKNDFNRNLRKRAEEARTRAERSVHPDEREVWHQISGPLTHGWSACPAVQPAQPSPFDVPQASLRSNAGRVGNRIAARGPLSNCKAGLSSHPYISAIPYLTATALRLMRPVLHCGMHPLSRQDGSGRATFICDALETDWPVGAAGFEPPHFGIEIRQDTSLGRQDSNLRIRNRARLGTTLSCGAKSDSRSCAGLPAGVCTMQAQQQ